MATKATRKTSTSTEIVLGQAAQQIAKGVSELNSASATISQLVKASEDLSLQVANKETQIADLDIQFAEKARQLEVELDLNFRANSEKVVTSFLTESGKVAISKTDLSNLQKELADTKANADAITKKEVAIVSSSLKSQHENEIKLMQSENKAVGAENTAKLNALVDKNTLLENQVAKLYQQLDAERAAGIARAQAGSVGSINVSSDRK